MRQELLTRKVLLWIAAFYVLLFAVEPSKAQQQELMAGAKKERELRIYTVMPVTYNQRMLEAFSQRYPFARLTYFRSRGDVLSKVPD